MARRDWIAGQRVRVRVVSNVDRAAGWAADGGYLAGAYDRDLAIVYVKTMRERQRARTYLHEAIHVALRDLRVALKLSEVKEEQIVRTVERLFPLLWRQGWRPGL